MVTRLTAGKFYFIEAIDDGAGDNNWITTGGGDPDTIDLDHWTEGLDYVSIDIPRGFTRSSFTGAIVTPTGAGKQFDQRNATRFYKTLQRGIQTTLTNANLIDKFVMSDRHTSGASAVFKRYFMVVYFGTNNHLEFTDSGNNRKSYCRGIIISVATTWIESTPLNFILRINWDSVW